MAGERYFPDKSSKSSRFSLCLSCPKTRVGYQLICLLRHSQKKGPTWGDLVSYVSSRVRQRSSHKTEQSLVYLGLLKAASPALCRLYSFSVSRMRKLKLGEINGNFSQGRSEGLGPSAFCQQPGCTRHLGHFISPSLTSCHLEGEVSGSNLTTMLLTVQL